MTLPPVGREPRDRQPPHQRSAVRAAGAAAAVLAAFTLGAGCGVDAPDSILDIEVAEASFSNPQLLAGGVAMGAMRIDADLAVTDPAGGEHSFPVSLSGMELGSVGIWTNQADRISELDISGLTIELPDSVPSEDGGQEGPVTLRHLFTEYTGMGFGLHVIIGGGVFSFSSDDDVTIIFAGFTPGFGINWGMCPSIELQLQQGTSVGSGEGS